MGTVPSLYTDFQKESECRPTFHAGARVSADKVYSKDSQEESERSPTVKAKAA